jgi:hypothetical protein
MNVDPHRVKELFTASLDLPDAQARQAFVDRHSAGDPDLRRLTLRASVRNTEVSSCRTVRRCGHIDRSSRETLSPRGSLCTFVTLDP